MGSSIISRISFGIILCMFFLSKIEAHRGRSGGGDKHGGRHGGISLDKGREGQFPLGNLNKQDLLKNVTAALNSQPKENLIEFFTVMSSADAQKQLKVLKVDQATIDQLLAKLKGTDQQVAEAKQTITNYLNRINLDKVTKKEWHAAVHLFIIYTTYKCKQDLKKAVTQDSMDNLTAGLTSLAAIENYVWFRGILFKDLLNTLKTKGGQGRQEVVDKLTKWIDTADPQTLTKAAIIYSLATKGSSTATTPAPSGQPTSPPPAQSTTPGPSATSPGVPQSSTANRIE